MPLLLYVLVLLPTLVLIGQTKPIVKSGTLMVAVLGSLVILVLILIILMYLRVRLILVVLMIPQVVQVSEMSLVVMDRLDVLGQAMIVLY